MTRLFRFIPGPRAPQTLTLPSGRTINRDSHFVDLSSPGNVIGSDGGTASANGWIFLCEIGPTANRPRQIPGAGVGNPGIGYSYYDVDQLRAIWWNGRSWVAVDGGGAE